MTIKTTRRSEFYAECVKRAFRGKLLLAEAASGLLALVAVPIGLWFDPTTQNAMNWAPLAIFIAVFFATIIFGLVAAPYWLYRDLEAQRNTLSERLDNRERRRIAIGKLWTLRDDGVNIRNQRVIDSTYSMWRERYLAWRENVMSESQQVSHGLHCWLDTLDRVRQEPGNLPQVEVAEHGHARRNMSEVLLRMGEFLEAEMLHRDIRQIEAS